MKGSQLDSRPTPSLEITKRKRSQSGTAFGGLAGLVTRLEAKNPYGNQFVSE